MTINSSTRIAGPYTGNGSTTAFPFSFKVFTTADVTVVRTNLSGVESTLTLGTDYTVSLNANQNSNPGGTVTMLTAPASGFLITLTSSLGYTQTLDLTNQGGFYPSVINDALDRATIQIQQLNEQVGRAAKVNISSGTDTTSLVNNINTLANNLTTVQAVNANQTNINLTATNITSVQNAAANAATATAQAVIATAQASASSASATSAASSATSATSSASAAATSATNAANSASAASGNATTSTSAASTATTQATNAASSASAASTSAANASTSASSAATSASTASSGATTATAQAVIATTQASSASSSATSAASSATSAATSATAAAAAAASGLYRQVLDKSANYSIVTGDQGTLFRVSTGSGPVTITLPLISSVTDGFKVSVVKWTGDLNGVTVSRSGSDTINGATTASLGSQYTQTTFVADLETNQWFGATSGLGSTNVVVDVLSGNGGTSFTLSGEPGTKNNTWVHVSTTYQNKSTYSISGSTITFNTAPASGTSNIEVVWTQPLPVGTPSDATITTVKMVDAAITTSKLADASVATAKLQDAAVSTAKLADGSVTATKLAAGAAAVAGEIKMWPTASAPTGFLICNGSAISRATYATLFAVLGTTFGSGDGSTTFNIPDFRDRMPIGAGNTYSANSLGGSANAIVVSHNHTATTSISDPGHSHSTFWWMTNDFNAPRNYKGIAYSDDQQGNTTVQTDAAGTGISASTSIATTGASATNANLPPYLGIYFIIKT